jgi:hypothetical protein
VPSQPPAGLDPTAGDVRDDAPTTQGERIGLGSTIKQRAVDFFMSCVSDEQGFVAASVYRTTS